MQASFGEFFEDLESALREAVRQLGGNKKVGPMLRPELPIDQASNWLRDCLNATRREKLSPEQVLLLLKLSAQAGFHGAMGFLAFAAGYEVKPIEAEEQEAQLQRDFVNAVDRLESIQRQIKQAQQMRRVA